MNYAIETIELVKRYPTRAISGAVRAGGSGGRGRGKSIPSFTGIFSVLKGRQGPFVEALKGVNLQIKRGEIFGILGPNGAGKTTLIKILCTLVLHDGGEVYVNGHDLSREPGEVLKNLQAVLPESRGFDWRLSGRQNLEFYALLYGLKDAEAKKRIDYLLDFTGLKDRADDGYQMYSTGMQRRLLLCRALIRDTPIIVFDEPTAGLDPTGAVEFRDMLMNRLALQEGKTILLSTHNLQEAQGLCDRIAILDRGNVIACDTPDNVRHLATEKRTLRIAFLSVTFGENQHRLVSGMQEVSGVHSVAPELNQEGILSGLSIRIEKDVDLSRVLSLMADSGLDIKSVNTEEPSLEDAFMAMTGRMGPRRSQIRTEE